MTATDAATFERFRAFADEAVTQLVQEMAEKRVEYPSGVAGNVLTLLDDVAHIQRFSPWTVWESWALRHALAVHNLLLQDDELNDLQNKIAMRTRLRDLLGYCVLGLLLAERDR
jgi:hypothetical protein